MGFRLPCLTGKHEDALNPRPVDSRNLEVKNRMNESQAAAEVHELRKSYRKNGDREPFRAVDGISFAVPRGQILGLLGPNGAGKSTTIKCLCGLIVPDSGQVRVSGIDVQQNRSAALSHISAVLEGNRNIYWRLTPVENLVYFAGNRGVSPARSRPRAFELLERFGLAHKANEQVNNLSRGMQQKLAIAVALQADSDLVLLDEPTLGLDVDASTEVVHHLQELTRQGRTVIISTHDMGVVQELCERVVIINGGRVVTDDRVGNLLELFNTLTFRVILAEPLLDPLVLKRAFPDSEFSDEGRSFTVTLESGDQLYALTHALEAADAQLTGLDRLSNDFGHVFRTLISQDRAREVARA